MSWRTASVLAGLAMLPAAVAEEQGFPQLSGRVPYFEKRLKSTRWEVRYCLLGALGGRDAESKRVLELLSQDKHDAVASQALRRYEGNFIRIDRSLFRPELYFRGAQFLGRTPATGCELVDGCLAQLRRREKDVEQNARDAYDLVHLVTVVGILGAPGDAAQLHRFLDSENDYVALHAAMAVIRLGDRVTGGDALIRLTKRNPAKHLCYMTEALQFLKEIEHPEFRLTLLDTLSAVDRTEGIPPNWLSGFLLLAAEVDESVWTPKEAPDAARAGERK